MTEKDEQDLRELQGELIASDVSLWEPRCVAACFARKDTPFDFTMQAWIDLDAVKSPFLLGKLPATALVLIQFREAFAAFGHFETTPEACGPDDLILLGNQIIDAISEAFQMRVKLAPPDGCRAAHVESTGMGGWVSLFACLKSQLGFSLSEAMALNVGKAFALIAAHRCNDGWSVAGETYSQRDIPETEETP
jgi:hypothetical protein